MYRNCLKPGLITLCLIIMCMLSACSGSSDSSESAVSLKFEEANVSPQATVLRGDDSIEISWHLSLANFYYFYFYYHLEVYLSTDEILDDGDTLLYKGDFYWPSGDISIYLNDLGSFYPNKYFILLKAEMPDGPSDVASIPFTLKAPEKSWTVMVYMAGDNSLSGFTGDDLSEMEMVGSSNEVNILVLRDTKYAPANLLYVERGQVVTLKNWGEVNMAAPETLEKFADFAFRIYPARHYMLVLWDHGLGFKFVPRRDIFEDYHPDYEWMDIPTLGKALNNIKNNLGRPIDIVGFDACFMGMLEVAHKIKDLALIMVASENYELGPGWDYEGALSPLVNNPDIAPPELARKLVQAFAEEYQDASDATLSALNLLQIGNVSQAVDSLAKALISAIDTNSATLDTLTGTIFENVQRFDDDGDDAMTPNDSFADLYHLATLIKQEIPSLETTAQEVLDALDNCVISSWYSSDTVANAHGLSIWFPDPSTYSSSDWDYYWAHYNDLDFAKETSWPDLIKAMWGL